jgi:ubiquinone/menaquinone biosynthesis C-methylase UbiE
MASLNDQVRAFWEAGACGTDAEAALALPKHSREWFEAVEANRYRLEPFIHGFAQFTRHHGKTILEVGVGAGTDHLQWARAGCRCHGVDLTEEAIETTRARFALYGFRSDLQRIDAERLPFADQSFDLVYSWGVIHHSERPEAIIAEIHRVLRPGGLFLGMLYNRRALVTLRLWGRRALLAGKPWRSFGDVLWHHFESVGTKAYTAREIAMLFGRFAAVESAPVLTPYDKRYLPRFAAAVLPDAVGFFRTVRAVK